MTTTTIRFFNTAGPTKTDIHYYVPLLLRLDEEKYFVLHAPRQTGKTSALFALKDALNASGEFRCAYANIEAAQTSREGTSWDDKVYRREETEGGVLVAVWGM